MSAAPPSSTAGLHPLEARLSFREYLGQIWQRRDFLIVVPRQDARAKQMTNVLGQAWHLLNPALVIAVYYFIFGVALNGDRGVDDYVTFLTVGILTFQLIQRIVVEASTTMHRHLGLIRSIQFPRALLPLSTIIEHLVAFLPTILLLYIVAFLDGVEPSLKMLLVPVALIPTLFITLGMALMTARLGAALPDMKDILPHFFRLLLYASGVIFSVEAVIGNEVVRNIMKSNPIYLTITVMRWSVLGAEFGGRDLLLLGGWCVLLPVVGFVIFRGGEHTYGS